MLQGLYSAAAGMAAQQQRIDAVSNAVANVSTNGYQKTRLSFRDLAYADVPSGNGVRAGAGAGVASAGRSQQAGSLQATGEALDVAIEGEATSPCAAPTAPRASPATAPFAATATASS